MVALWLVSALVGLLVLAVVKFAMDRASYPPGPMPLPLVGNLLALRGTKTLGQKVEVFRKRYGDVFTLWMGSKPMVFVCSWDRAKEGLLTKKNDFSGRMSIRAMQMILDGRTDVAFSDPSPTWEVLRKIGFSAVRKFTPLPLLRETTGELTDTIVEDMLQKKEPFDPREYLQFVVLNVIANIAYRLRWDKDDQDLLTIKEALNNLPILLSKSIPGDFMPILRLREGGLEKTMKDSISNILALNFRLFDEQKEAFNGEVRGFTDAVLAAREEADPSEVGLKYLTDGELKMVLNNLFNAGVATTKETITWTVLLLGIHPRVQEKIAEEINAVIGDRQPTQEDRKTCHYTVAVLNEVLRYRSPTIVGLPHKTLCDTSLGGLAIPKDTAVVFFQESVHFDASHWAPDPERFRPERFLDDPEAFRSHYMPFGVGRRSCIGERLALANLFLILVRLVQRCSWTVHGEPDDRPEPAAAQACISRPFKIEVKAR